MDYRLFVFALLGNILGNFLFALWTDQQWHRALDRSYFQAVVVASCAFLSWLR
jgi:hypothetical protein